MQLLCYVTVALSIAVGHLRGHYAHPMTTTTTANPMENPDLFEGDILGVPLAKDVKVAAQLGASYKWPNGIIPYTIDGGFSLLDVLIITTAMRSIENSTKVNGVYCVRFKPRTTESAYLRIYRGSGCISQVGKQSSQPQTMSLDKSCIYKGIIIHELLHVAGFWHMQNRWDRDDWIIVNYNNVLTGQSSNFNKFPWSTITSYGLPYDYNSIMHYSATAFSKNGQPTIVARYPSLAKSMVDTYLKQGMTPTDVAGVRRFYSC